MDVISLYFFRFEASLRNLPDPERAVWRRRSLDSISAVDCKLILLILNISASIFIRKSIPKYKECVAASLDC